MSSPIQASASVGTPSVPAARRSEPPKVSVVVPVYNPGEYIRPCIDSLLGQTLPAEEFEVILVDDGSTDDTPALLDRLAEEHAHVRVIHIPNSGWPGKPRNIGVEAARGEYVQFVDQDDHLAPDALRRLYGMGRRNGSDIVLGKVASNFRGVPHGVFAVDREKCTLRDAPLHDSLTPHKMFRTAFLREQGITYPEGKRRLEDQVYMMEAYFPAQTVSILSSYTCYFYSRRGDGGNAGSAGLVPSGYYGNLREVLDIVVANTEPGEFRDLLLRRFYRGEMLGRLSEPSVLTYEPEFLADMCAVVRGVAEDYMTEGVHEGLGAVARVRSTLLRRGDERGLAEIARRAAEVKGAARLESFAWQPDGGIAVDVTARLTRGDDGLPFTLLRQGDRYYLHPDFTGGLSADDEPVEVTAEMGDFSAALALRNRETAVEWPLDASFTTEIEDLGGGLCQVLLRVSGTLRPGAVEGRAPVSRGYWDVWVPMRGLGLVRKARLGSDRDEGVAGQCLPAFPTGPGRPVIPYFTHPQGNLTLDVGRRGRTVGAHLADRPVSRMPGQSPELRLPIFTTARTAPVPVDLVLESGDGGRTSRSAVLVPVLGRAQLRLPERVTDSPAGAHRLLARLDGPKGPEAHLCDVVVGRGGRLRIADGVPVLSRVEARAVGDVERERSRRDRRRRTRARLRAVIRPVLRRLPASVRRGAARAAKRLGI